jgi:DnaJ homolog subfamily C member 2
VTWFFLVVCVCVCTEEKHLTAAEKIARREAARRAAVAKQQGAKKPGAVWSKEDMVVLIKATKKFPAGSSERWQQIAAMVNKLSPTGTVFEAPDCIKKANELTHLDKKLSDASAGPAEAGSPPPPATHAAPVEWSSEQQAQLEQGLRTMDRSLPEAQRWAHIAAGVSGRNAQECQARFAYLRETLRKKG